MSAQSIVTVDKKYLEDRLDDFMIQQGLLFINHYDYDIEPKPDYKKIHLINHMKDICNRKTETRNLIHKILK